MNVTGIVAEYNPFHNGHLYHLKQSLKQSQGDVLIVVMSGHFTQRGEPAVINKWERTKMALANGADLVIELPYVFSCQHADLFAKGAVSILTQIHANDLIFGSESGKIDDLKRLESISKSENFQKELQNFIKLGDSVPLAHQKALTSLNLDTTLGTLPNNTLGVYYIRAVNDLKSNLSVKTIKRLHSDYHDVLPTHHELSSATSIRHLRETGQPYENYVPKIVHQLLEQNYELTKTYHTWESYFPFLKQKILTLTPRSLKMIHDVEEGIEHRLYAAMMDSTDFEDFMKKVKTKRYTRTRLQRICANILTHTTKELVQELDKGAPYIRILGASSKGRQYLKLHKKQINVPIYSKFDSKGHPFLLHEQAVTAAYSCILPEPHCTTLIQAEFKNFPIFLKS